MTQSTVGPPILPHPLAAGRTCGGVESQRLWLGRNSLSLSQKFQKGTDQPTSCSLAFVISYSWQLLIYLRRKRYWTYSLGIASKCIWSLKIAELIITIHTKISIHAWSQIHNDYSTAHFPHRVPEVETSNRLHLITKQVEIIQIMPSQYIYIYIYVLTYVYSTCAHLASNCCF